MQREYLRISVKYFKTLSIGPALEIEHATSRIAVKRSTDWASPAVKKLDIAKSILITYFWPIDLLIW